MGSINQTTINQPTKEQVRQWMARRRQAIEPLPDCDQIRRQLGWAYLARAAQPITNKAQQHEGTP